MRHVIPDELEARTLSALEEECCGVSWIHSAVELNTYVCRGCGKETSQADVYREAMNRAEGFQTLDREERRRLYAEKRAARRARNALEAESRRLGNDMANEMIRWHERNKTDNDPEQS